MIRHNNVAEYDLDDWDTTRRFPSGVAALADDIASFGLVPPCMSQVWFTGPIAKPAGDIGFEAALGISAVLYLPFRLLEIEIEYFLAREVRGQCKTVCVEFSEPMTRCEGRSASVETPRTE